MAVERPAVGLDTPFECRGRRPAPRALVGASPDGIDLVDEVAKPC